LLLKNYEYIEPLVLSDISSQSQSLSSIRSKIEQFIIQKKASQNVDDVSVYFKRLTNGEWFNINPGKTYIPASMIKLAYLITFLKDAERNPNLLTKKVHFLRHYSVGTEQNIKEFSLQENSMYSIRDLLTYMIQYSDNDATIVLRENMNMSTYFQVYKDLDIPTPSDFGEYFITTAEYSKFFRVLFNSTYIRPDLSEFGMKLLTLSNYKEGLAQGIDPDIKIAHKFGERILGTKSQLHEFGIVYVKGDPYLIGVMSMGSSLKQLSGVLSEISKIAFSEYKSLSNS
jgi:hypothetical protein